MRLSEAQQNDQLGLQRLATQVATGCPDMRQHAREIAQDILSKHNYPALDPDQVYLHRFNTAVSSPRTFSGWMHLDRPYQSLTLPQLVMHRFDPDDAENEDLLGYLTGFYTDGPEQETYDEHNELAIPVRDVLDEFWKIDFSSDFRSSTDTFWSRHSDGFRTLAKSNFLSKVLEQVANHPGTPLTLACLEASQALTGVQHWPPTLAQLRQQVLPASTVRLCTFDIAGHTATDILRIELSAGRQLLYMPGEVDALQLFTDKSELYFWVLTHNNHADNRARFVSHFSLPSRGEDASQVGLEHLIDLLYQQWGKQDFSQLDKQDQTISGDAFSWLRDQARHRMVDDAKYALRSNADLRKEIWIGYLHAFTHVFGPMAALAWPVALAVVGAGLADMGLNIDKAVNGRTTAERKAGVIGAIVAGVNTLFNLTFLRSAPGAAAEIGETGGLVEAGERPGTAEPGEAVTEDENGAPAEDENSPSSKEDIQSWVPRPFWPQSYSQALLEPFETNLILKGKPGNGTLEGIYTQDGNFYALVDEQPYQVRRVAELNSWVIVDPENPYSFYTSQLIRLDTEGQWQLVPRAGLKGGLPLKNLKIWGRTPARAPLPPLTQSPYEIPVPVRPSLRSIDDLELSGVQVSFHDAERYAATVQFRELRDRLATDAAEFMANPVVKTRPRIPEVHANTSSKMLLRSVYENSNGLVVGEGHSDLGSKRFLIDNMGQLRQLKVKTLYMEHYTTDFQQADLDTFNRTGQMTEELDRYVSAQDRGHLTDPTGRYNFRQVLVEAQKNGVRVQAIDCLASYRQAWETAPSPLTRQQMMNFYAHQVIEADQTIRGPGRWVALMGNSHANTFHGVTGVAELEGAIGLRVEDVPIGQPDTFDVDPGRDVPDANGNPLHIRSDLRLRVSIRATPLDAPELMAKLPRPGDYLVEDVNGEQFLVNRSRDMTLRRTPIKRDGRYYYVERPDWPSLHGRRLNQLADLHTQLRRQGMRRVDA